MNTVVSGVGVVLSRAGTAVDLIEPGPADAPPVVPTDIVGTRRMRYKDRATLLAFCAADAALRDAGLVDHDGLRVPAESVAVVTSSNYGNVDTVCRALDTIMLKTTAAGSPMDLPNASSNVVSSSVAIRHTLRGPNLMLCNGATSGLDAVHWAMNLIRGGRASRALVIGVEPDNEAVRELTGAGTVDGAAAMVLESAAAAAERGATAQAVLGEYVRGGGLTACLERLESAAGERPALWQLPDPAAAPLPEEVLRGVTRHDLGALFGTGSGALGVLQCAAAVGWFARGGDGPVFATAGTDADDATAGITLRRPAA